jgi:hypothetical protein
VSTTQLFAELLVIGLGVVIWLLFLAATVFEFSWQDIASNTNLLTLAPIGGIAYVLGIVFDRIGPVFRTLRQAIATQGDSRNAP